MVNTDKGSSVGEIARAALKVGAFTGKKRPLGVSYSVVWQCSQQVSHIILFSPTIPLCNARIQICLKLKVSAC